MGKPGKEILHENDSAALNLKEIANILTIHPVHLSRSFKKYFHCNLEEYIRRIKIEKATLGLLNSDQSLTAIAHECGFTDQSHFIRMFKDYLRMNPSLFKKIQKAKC